MGTKKTPMGFIEVVNERNRLSLININHIVYLERSERISVMDLRKYTTIYFAQPYEYGVSSLDVVGDYDEIVEKIRKAQEIGE